MSTNPPPTHTIFDQIESSKLSTTCDKSVLIKTAFGALPIPDAMDQQHSSATRGSAHGILAASFDGPIRHFAVAVHQLHHDGQQQLCCGRPEHLTVEQQQQQQQQRQQCEQQEQGGFREDNNDHVEWGEPKQRQ